MHTGQMHETLLPKWLALPIFASDPLSSNAYATEEALVDSVESAELVVVGISARWRRDGIGATRRALMRHARAPVLLVHRGPRPSLLAPGEARTRFTWTLEA